MLGKNKYPRTLDILYKKSSNKHVKQVCAPDSEFCSHYNKAQVNQQIINILIACTSNTRILSWWFPERHVTVGILRIAAVYIMTHSVEAPWRIIFAAIKFHSLDSQTHQLFITDFGTIKSTRAIQVTL